MSKFLHICLTSLSLTMAVVFFVSASLPLPAQAETGVPFGGLDTVEHPCDTGILIYLAGAPSGVIPVMWLWGELPFLDHVPPHPGQWLLGELAPVPVPCFVGHVLVGFGAPIEFHGDSL
jgi:hypothetical protein